MQPCCGPETLGQRDSSAKTWERTMKRYWCWGQKPPCRLAAAGGGQFCQLTF